MSQVNNVARSIIITLGLALTACGGTAGSDTILSTAHPELTPVGEPVSYAPVSIHTVIRKTKVSAGEDLHVECLYLDAEGIRVDGPAPIVETVPEASYTMLADVAVVRPTTAGTQIVRCQTPDGELVDLEGVSIIVDAGLPHSWFIEELGEDCYHEGIHLPIDVTVVDTWGNTVPNAQVTLDVYPSEGVTGDLYQGLRFNDEGVYDVSIMVEGDLAPGATIEAHVQAVHVDETGPSVEILSPARGEMLHLGTTDDLEVSVLASVVDPTSAITSASVNGVSQTIEGSHQEISVETTQTSRWGLSVVSATATDACGNVSHVAQSYLRSGTYLSATEPSEATIEGALVSRMSQSLIDDGHRDSLDDIASMAETALQGLDLDERLPAGAALVEDPYSEDCNGGNVDTSYRVARDSNVDASFTLDGPYIGELSLGDDSVTFEVSLHDFSLPLELEAAARNCMLINFNWADVALTAAVGVEDVVVSGTLSVSHENGNAVAAIDAFNPVFTGTWIDLDCGLVDFACDAITSAATGKIEEVLENTIREKVEATLPDMLENALETQRMAPTIELPAPVSMSLDVEASINEVSISGPESGAAASLVSIDASVLPSQRGESIDEDARGAIYRGAQELEFSEERELGIAVRDDFLNQLLWAVWYGGGFNVDLRESFDDKLPEAVESATISALLPPVVMPGTDGNVVDLGLGDLLINARVDVASLLAAQSPDAPAEVEPYFMDVEVYISARLGGHIELTEDGSSLDLQIGQDYDIAFDVQNLGEAAGASELGAMLSTVATMALPIMVQKVIGSYELPTLAIGDLSDNPEDTLSVENGSVTHTSNYVLLQADIEPGN